MKIKILKTEEDYKEAVFRLEEIGDSPNLNDDKDLINEFELLSKLIEEYEIENYPIDPGDPIEIIKMKMGYMGLIQQDLVPLIGSKGVVSEVLNKKRGLSKSMIRKLSEILEINQEILNTEYKLQNDNAKSLKRDKGETFKFLKPRGINPFEIQQRICHRGSTVEMVA